MKRIVIPWCIIGILTSLLILTSIYPVFADQGDPYFYSFDYSTYDSDNDEIHDAVRASFDPDFPSDYSASVIVNVELYQSNGTLIKSVSGTFFISGYISDYLVLDLGTVSTAGSYYLYGEILFDSVSTDTITTESFRLGISPYFYSFDWDTYDADDDEIDEGVKVTFDPDFPNGYSGSVTIKVKLYLFNGTLVKSVSETYLLNEDDYDSLEMDLGAVNAADEYFIVGEIIFNSMISDTITSPTFRLGLLPFFYSFDYISYDSNNDGFNDGIEAEFDPDFPGGSSGTVIVYVDLYKSLRTLVNSVSGTYFINGNVYDNFKLNLGTVNSSGNYYLFSDLFFASTSADTRTTTTFYLHGLLPTNVDNETTTSETLITSPNKTTISVERTGQKRGETKTKTIINSETTDVGSISIFIGVVSLITVIWLQKKNVV